MIHTRLLSLAAASALLIARSPDDASGSGSALAPANAMEHYDAIKRPLDALEAALRDGNLEAAQACAKQLHDALGAGWDFFRDTYEPAADFGARSGGGDKPPADPNPGEAGEDDDGQG